MRKILIQLDSDRHPSVFDRVVAVDAGADEIFAYGDVRENDVVGLVHGGMFTRGPGDLKNTAIFIGGSDVSLGDRLFQKACSAFFGPIQLSVMVDSNGSNTTAAATVLAVRRHLPLDQVHALILGGTGPVGVRTAQILLSQGATVRLASRSLEKAETVCEWFPEAFASQRIVPVEYRDGDDWEETSDGVNTLISAGAAGVQLVAAADWQQTKTIQVAVDLNAAPPSGIEGIQVMDKAASRNGVLCYGAIGVGGTKMKIHQAAIRKLFESNSARLDTASIFELGLTLG